jgi:mono/diheme cytochrome c family protein
MRPNLILAALLLVPFICLAQSQKNSSGLDREGQARLPVEGARIFAYRCASCHGADGRGHGPASVTLKHAAPNLTLISQRNGGRFPYQQIKEVIEGKQTSPLARGYRQMPLYGPVFHEVEADQDWGEVRLDAITKQVESMQQK